MANNWAAGERTDVWVARHCGRRPAAFYGFDVEVATMTDGEVNALYLVPPSPFPAFYGQPVFLHFLFAASALAALFCNDM